MKRRAGASSRTTIRDIARRAGVSVATVSRVINGRPDVSPDTREAVLRLIRQDGYSGSRQARALASGRTDLIALTVPSLYPEYFNQIVEGAAEALYERDARFVICSTHHQHDREVLLLERVMHGTTDGGVLVVPSESSEELLYLRDNGFPFVVVDPALPIDEDIPVVQSSNWSGARSVTEHLIELGHRHIAAITGPATWKATVDRLAGYQAALLASGHALEPRLVLEGLFTLQSGYEAARALLAAPEPPTAVFAFNDPMAIGALHAAEEMGFEVPRDLSVAGFDDVFAASIVKPHLTTVRQPLQEMGRVAASLLFRLMDGGRVEATRMELSTRLVVRASTGPARG